MTPRRVLAAVLLALALVPSAAMADVTCRSEEDPGGNVLVIRADAVEDQAAIVRRGSLIRVSDDRTGEGQACAGQPPTVHNIDNIWFTAAADGAGIFVSLAGGKFAPGVPPTGPDSKILIEFRTLVDNPGNVGVGGTSGQDNFAVLTPPPGYGRTGISFDANDRGVDLAFPRGMVGALVRTGAGNDLVSGARLKKRISLSVYAGAGADRIIGGPMTDLIFGRRGADRINGWGGADEVDCGLGLDFARLGSRDRHVNCERIARPVAGRLAFP